MILKRIRWGLLENVKERCSRSCLQLKVRMWWQLIVWSNTKDSLWSVGLSFSRLKDYKPNIMSFLVSLSAGNASIKSERLWYTVRWMRIRCVLMLSKTKNVKEAACSVVFDFCTFYPPSGNSSPPWHLHISDCWKLSSHIKAKWGNPTAWNPPARSCRNYRPMSRFSV